MSFAYLIIYEGRPEDPEAFLNYYIEKHVPLVRNFQKIRDIEIQHGVDGGDFFMITSLTFDTLDDLHTAINSKERALARDDMDNFPPFKGRVRWQAVEIIEMQRGGN